MTVQNYFNRAINPRYARLENGTTVPFTWGSSYGDSTGGAGALGSVTQSLTGGPSVSASYASYSSGVSLNTQGIETIGEQIDVQAGDRLTIGIWGWIGAAFDSASVLVDWFDATGASVGVESEGPRLAVAASTWVERAAIFDVPSGAVKAMVQFAARRAAAGASAQIRGTAVYAVSKNDTGAEYSGGFFDGASAAVGNTIYAWTNGSNQSFSIATVTVPDPTPATAPNSGTATPIPGTGTARTSFKTVKLFNYSVTEESTPIDSSDQTGGVGSMSLVVSENDESREYNGVQIDLVVPSLGTTRGTMGDVSSQDGVATISAAPRLALLVPVRDAQPFVGTLSAAILYYIGLVGITTGILVDSSFASINVVLQGWSALSVWFQLKELLAVYDAEIALVSNNIVVRPVRQIITINYRDESVGWHQDSSQLAQSVQVYRYSNQQILAGLVYPAGGWTSDVEVLTVAEGETKLVPLAISASLISVVQPTCVSFVGPTDSSASVYTVTGTDDLPITPAEWAALGGSLTVAIDESTNSLTATIVGAVGTDVGPFRICMSASDSSDYSSLRILGTGVSFDKEIYTFQTGVSADVASTAVGVTVDNPVISSMQQVYDAAGRALHRFGSIQELITVTSAGINRLGSRGSYAHPTFSYFTSWFLANHPGATFGSFDTLFTGQTFAQFNSYFDSMVASAFANQAFGNIGGARRLLHNRWFRIRTAQITPSGIQYSAEDDTVMSDFDSTWAGATFGGFDAEWNAMLPGATFADFDRNPLRRLTS